VSALSRRRVALAAARSLVSNELNYSDSNISSEANSSGSFQLLNGLTLGTSATTRLGQRIRIVSVQLHLQIKQDTTALLNATRCWIVLDNQANGATPAFTDVFVDANPYTMRTVSGSKRFQVIWDSGQIASAGNQTAGQITEGGIKVIDLFRKMDAMTEFKTTNNGDITDIQTGALYFMLAGTAVTGTSTTEVAGRIRIRYQA